MSTATCDQHPSRLSHAPQPAGGVASAAPSIAQVLRDVNALFSGLELSHFRLEAYRLEAKNRRLLRVGGSSPKL